MRKFYNIILLITFFTVFAFSHVPRTEAGSTWLVIDYPRPAPLSGEVFETTLRFFTWDAVVGTYSIAVHYDPAILQILQVTTPPQSEFYGNTLVDENSFISGTTDIAAFQVGNLSEQPSPTAFAIIQWKALGAPGTPTTIELESKTVVDTFWRPIDVLNWPITFELNTPIADLSLTKSDNPDPVIAGNQLTYTVTVTNGGPSDATNVILTDIVPSQIQNPEYSIDGGNSWNSWIGAINLGTISDFGSRQVLIRGTVASSVTGIITNTADVISDTSDPNSYNNSALETTTVNSYGPQEREVCPDGCQYSYIQEAIDYSGPGDLIKIAQGTYYGNIFINKSKEITLQGGWDSSFISKTNDPSLTVINGDITGDGIGDGSVININAASGTIIVANIENFTIMNGSANTGGGINVISSDSGNIQFALLNSIITGNNSEKGGGIYVESSSSAITALTFINNIIVENTATYGGGIDVYSRGPESTVDLAMINNTITENTADYGGGLFAKSSDLGATTVTVENEIIWGNNGDDIYIYQDNSTTSVSTSCSDIGKVVIDTTYPGIYISDITNIEQDPIFINPAMDNYRLNSDSPCIDAGGTPMVENPIDFEGDPRPQGSDFDIGADEYVEIPFTSIEVLAPNGGERLPSGEKYNITWGAPTEAVKFKLMYSTNNAKGWKKIHKEKYVTGTSYDWSVPINKKDSKKCLVKVCGYKMSGKKVGCDKSDTPFTIEGCVQLILPNGGETLISGSTYPVTWDSLCTKKTVAKVILKYTTNGGRKWKKISTIRGSDPESYVWDPVPTVKNEKTTCKVMVVLKDAKGKTLCKDVSDDYFTISRWECLDDDEANGIYRICNYFPLDPNNQWNYTTGDRFVIDDIETCASGYSGILYATNTYEYSPYMQNKEHGLLFAGCQYDEGEFEDWGIPFMLIPPEMEIGEAVSQYIPPGTMPGHDYGTTFNTKLVGLETITVPAGTFATLKVEFMTDDVGHCSYKTTLWLAKGIGPIKIHRTEPNPADCLGCMFVCDPDNDLIKLNTPAELLSAIINGITY